MLLIHNRYQEPGGEEAVYEAEGDLLESRGHRVVRYETSNDRVNELGRAHLGARTVWSIDAHHEVARIVRRERPDVAHVHNTLPLLSPSVHHALAGAGVAVVQTLHNYRLLCPQGMLLRDGRPCTECVGRAPLPGVLHACYRGSRAATAAVAVMLTVHRALGTWSRAVDAFIALSHFARERFIEGGLPEDRLHVKPNFVDPDPGVGAGAGGFLLYVGRLTPEKGVPFLLDAWRRVATGPGGPRLVIVGDGPLAERVRQDAAELPGLEWHGAQPLGRVLELMGEARALVFPSLCFENSPRVILEAYARGLPVLAGRQGSGGELVRDDVTGWLFAPGDPADLARAMARTFAGAAERARLAHGARAAFEASHTADSNVQRLMEIYAAARRVRLGRVAARDPVARGDAGALGVHGPDVRPERGSSLAGGRPA